PPPPPAPLEDEEPYVEEEAPYEEPQFEEEEPFLDEFDEPEPEPEPEPVPVRRRSAPRRKQAAPVAARQAEPEPEPAPLRVAVPQRDWRETGLKTLVFFQSFGSWLAEGSRQGKRRLTETSRQAASLTWGVAWRAAVLLLSLLSLYQLYGYAARPKEPTLVRPEGPDIAQAASVVLAYHRHLQDGNFARAYATLSPSWQKELSLRQFESGFYSLGRLRYRLVGMERGDRPGQAWARVNVRATHRGRLREYDGYYLVVYTEFGWRLAETHLSLKAVGPAYAAAGHPSL
ncbi:MAG: hypothetical protein KC910_30840, partial [Candidatus Eremiobacteraeota bacterium]|nr:hypothetical protein [Candidatus Eremiobacteraeota bacterium]